MDEKELFTRFRTDEARTTRKVLAKIPMVDDIEQEAPRNCVPGFGRDGGQALPPRDARGSTPRVLARA
jgi:hypothetical protein